MPWQGRKKCGFAKTSAGGIHWSMQELLRTIKIGQHGIEQRGALDDRPFDLRPFVSAITSGMGSSGQRRSLPCRSSPTLYEVPLA